MRNSEPNNFITDSLPLINIVVAGDMSTLLALVLATMKESVLLKL